jgi:hypothetical protein
MRIHRCYDPRRMSSARARILPSLGRAVRGIVWTALFAVLAASAAGLIAEASHAPGSAARGDLTAEGDAALNARLDGATAALEKISADVDRLADDAKTALEEIASSDPSKLQQSLQDGSDTAETIDAETGTLRGSLTGLPGDEPDAVIRYSNDTLVRRAAVLAALDAAASLNAHWQQVTGKAVEASDLTTLIAQHDQVVLDAAAKGRSGQYADAASTLDDAILAVANVREQRDKLIADTSRTVLDEWIDRNRDYDLALKSLYLALDKSGGRVNVTVQAARRAERDAFDRLPPDRRTIIVIALEDARGRIEDALAEAGGQPGASIPPETEAPAGTEEPLESEEPGPTLP